MCINGYVAVNLFAYAGVVITVSKRTLVIEKVHTVWSEKNAKVMTDTFNVHDYLFCSCGYEDGKG